MARRASPSPELLRSLSGAEPEEVVEYAEATGRDPDDLLWYFANGHRFLERPVDAETFLFDPAYMAAVTNDGQRTIWPLLVEDIKAIIERRPAEVLLTGAIGTGKTTVATYSLAYLVYWLLCHRDPHQTFGLTPESEIMVMVQSLNLRQAADVGYRRFRNLLESAPIFRDPLFDFDRTLKSRLEFRANVRAVPMVGTDTAALGANVIGGFIDEVTSMQVVQKSLRRRDKEVYDQAMALYNTVATRLVSRFLERGEMPGFLMLGGSKQYPDDFMHKKLSEAVDRPERFHVVDRALWEAKPWSFGSQRFPVFVGDETRQPRILESGDEEEKDLVVWVPEELRHEFVRDVVGSIRDLAGVANMPKHSLILNREAATACFGATPGIISRPDCDFLTTRPRVYPARWRGSEKWPRFVHVDLSRSADSTGVAIGHVPRFVRIKRGELTTEPWPVIRFDAILEVRPPPSGEIIYARVRELLYKLREHGLPIRWVTADSYQSTDMLQVLATRGFQVGEESTDKTPAPYLCLKEALYDGRVEAPEHEKCLRELLELEVDPDSGKIDHRPEGSKDVADAVACVAFGLTLQAEVWALHNQSIREVPPTLAELAEMASTEREVDGKVGE